MTYIKGKQLYIDDLDITTLRVQQDVFTTGSIMSLGTGSYMTGSLDGTATNAISASYAVTASYISGFIASASYAISASYAPSTGTSSLSISASYAKSASYSDTALSASYAPTTGTSSFSISSSYSQNSISSSYALSASLAQTASYTATSSYSQNTISASYSHNSDNAISSSYATSASYAKNSDTSSLANIAISASYTSNSISASYALSASEAITSVTASYAISASYTPASVSSSHAINSDTASYVQNAISASYSLSSSKADLSSTASYVQNALSASRTINADTASYVVNAISASYVITSVSSSYSQNTLSASYALTASYVLGGGGSTGANPTAIIGLTVITGSATTFMRSDAAPGLNLSIAPTWLGSHSFSSSISTNSITPLTNNIYTIGASGNNYSQGWFSTLRTPVLRANGSTGISFENNASGIVEGLMFESGNWTLQNGGTYTDNGYKLEIPSSGSVGYFKAGSLSVATSSNVLINTTTDSGFKFEVAGTSRIQTGIQIGVVSGATQSAPSGSLTGGTLPAGTYYYKIVSVDSNFNTSIPGNEVNITVTGSTNTVTLSWTVVVGAANYRVYRGTISGGESVYYATSALTYTDTGAAATSGSLPTINTTGVTNLLNDGSINGYKFGTGPGSNASGNLVLGSGNAMSHNTTGASIVSIGVNTLALNTTGQLITAVGYQALQANTTGAQIIAIGVQAGYGLTTGQYNIAIGNSAMGANTSFCIGIGMQALQNSTGQNSIGMGTNAIYYNTTGANNVGIGYQVAMFYSGSSSNHATAIDNSVFLGYQAGPLGNSQTNQIAIGYNSIGSGSNTTTLGNGSTVATYIAGGTLTVAGTAIYTTGSYATLVRNITTGRYETIIGTSSTTTNTSGSDANYTINLNGGDNIILPAITAGRTVTFPTIVDGKLIWIWNQNSSVNMWSIAGSPLVESTLLGTQTTITNQTYTAYIGSLAQSAWIKVI